jgi:uncharacterized protein involved in oxidation of intracellular sulfur
MNILIIINDAPYGSEKAYNALRMAMMLQKEHEGVEVRMFLLADAVTCALANHNTPQGYYNIERMIKAILNKGVLVKACGSCCEARGLMSPMLIEGIEISTMSQLTQWLVDSDKVITF